MRTRSLAAGVLAFALLAACGAESSTSDASDGLSSVSEVTTDSSAAVTSVPAVAEPDMDALETSEPAMEPDEAAGESPASAVSPSDDVDLDQAPLPDADASAGDHPDFEWAFEEGHQAGLYGRADLYEPRSVAENPTAVGLVAKRAYYDGFAKGLADYEERQAEVAASSSAAEASKAAAWPTGELLPGWDQRTAASEFWGFDSPLATCEEAAADEPCADLWNNENNDFVVVARLDPEAGEGPDHALLLAPQVRGYEIEMFWEASAQAEPALPEWAVNPR